MTLFFTHEAEKFRAELDAEVERLRAFAEKTRIDAAERIKASEQAAFLAREDIQNRYAAHGYTASKRYGLQKPTRHWSEVTCSAAPLPEPPEPSFWYCVRARLPWFLRPNPIDALASEKSTA